jgi:signal peptidase I
MTIFVNIALSMVLGVFVVFVSCILIKSCKANSRPTGKAALRSYVKTACIAVLCAVFLRVFLVGAYRISSASMEDTLLVWDCICVNKLAYRFGSQPQPGDVIVFRHTSGTNVVKRVVAVEGQTVEVRDKILYVDEEPASEPSTSKHVDRNIKPTEMSFRDNFGPCLIPEGTVFVMGDNRDNSNDSRFWGPVPEENIRGKALFVYFSWSGGPRLDRIGNSL